MTVSSNLKTASNEVLEQQYSCLLDMQQRKHELHPYVQTRIDQNVEDCKQEMINRGLLEDNQFLAAVGKVQEIAANNRQQYTNLDTTKLDMVMIDEYELLTWLVGYDNKVILDLIPVNFELNKCIANIYYIL